MTNRLLSVSFLLVGFVLALGCQSKGPVPGEGSPSEGAPPKVGTTETTGAHPGGANPHAGVPGAPGSDPHAGLGIAPVGKGPNLTDTGLLDIGAIAVKVPESWLVEPPKSSMRKAQMRAKGSAGDAELIVFYFGQQGAGSAQDNIERWVSQFTTAEGKPVTDVDLKNVQVNEHKISRVEVAGRFANNMPVQGQEVAPVEDQRLIAAIVSTVSGPYYMKFLGPNATVTENRAAFDAMLQSIVPAP
jgi:hypothetical protein